MNSNLIGGQITKFRKAAGLTQEELGRAVGVSTQAVSRWECGGAPDVSLLPAVADTLHVTVDALFGREGGAPENMGDTIRRWMEALPENRRMDELVRLLWVAFKYMMAMATSAPLSDVGFLKQCELLDRTDGEMILLQSMLELEEGLMLGVCADDMSFMTIYPEPEAGYAAYFSDNDSYRRLFDALAQPDSLELMLYLHSEKARLYLPEAVAQRMGIDIQRAEAAMARLESVRILEGMELELESGTVKAYRIRDNGALIPLLYSSRQIMQKEGYYSCWVDRERPWLQKKSGDRKKEGMNHENK